MTMNRVCALSLLVFLNVTVRSHFASSGASILECLSVQRQLRKQRMTSAAVQNGGGLEVKEEEWALSQWTAGRHVAWHNGGLCEVKEGDGVLCLWMAGSRADVRDWIERLEIPLRDGCAQKGRYVGFRNNAVRAMERFWRMPGSELVAKKGVLLIEVRLSADAFAKMATDIVWGAGWVPHLHYVSYPGWREERGVWYYHQRPFSLKAPGVYVLGLVGLV